MQHGCMERLNRKLGPEAWQLRWPVTGADGKRLYHKKIVGTVERYPDENAARRSVVGLVLEINTDGRATNSGPMTVAQLCEHFEQRELARVAFDHQGIIETALRRLQGKVRYEPIGFELLPPKFTLTQLQHL